MHLVLFTPYTDHLTYSVTTQIQPLLPQCYERFILHCFYKKVSP